MKTKILSLITTICLALSLYACDPPQKHYVTSMINQYVGPGELNLIDAGDNVILVRFDDIKYVANFASGRESHSVIFNELCRKHNDTSYDRVIVINPAYGYPYICLNLDFVSVSVTSDVDFDDEHPTGTELGDIILFHSVSVRPYIESGYTKEYDWNVGDYFALLKSYFSYRNSLEPSVGTGKNPIHPVERLVSGLTPEDMTLLGRISGHGGGNYPLALLEFVQKPTLGTKHKITVTLIDDEGEVYSATIDMTL